MKKKWYWIIFIIVILLIAISSPYIYLQYINYKLATTDIYYCKQTDDCTFVYECCGRVLESKNYAGLENVRNNLENQFFPQPQPSCLCPTVVLAAVNYEASCENNKCVKIPHLDCNVLCKEYNHSSMALIDTAMVLNMTTDDINRTCNC